MSAAFNEVVRVRRKRWLVRSNQVLPGLVLFSPRGRRECRGCPADLDVELDPESRHGLLHQLRQRHHEVLPVEVRATNTVLAASKQPTVPLEGHPLPETALARFPAPSYDPRTDATLKPFLKRLGPPS